MERDGVEITRAKGRHGAGRPDEPAPGIRLGQAFVLYLVLTTAMTWPLALHLGDTTPSRWVDSRLTTWILAWDAHTIAHDPTELFQAPVFHPERDTLAYTDHSFALGIFAAPITLASGNPYLGHNVVFILSIAFSAFAAFLAAREIGGAGAAPLVAGAVFGFAPYWFGHTINLSHIQILAAGWIPFTVFAFLRWRVRQTLPWAILIGASFAMAALTSWYQAAFLAAGLVVIALGLLEPRPVATLARRVGHLFVAALVAGAVLAPFAAPYQRVRARDPGYGRTIEQVIESSATTGAFLAAPTDNVLYGDLTASIRRGGSLEATLFPGLVTVGLAGLGAVVAVRHRERRRLGVTLLVLVVLGVVLTLGAAHRGFRSHLPWRSLADHVPIFSGLRAPARAHVLTLLGLALLVGIGAEALLRRAPRTKAAAVMLIAVIALEGTSVPLRLGPAPRAPVGYDALASRPGAVVVLPTGGDSPKGGWVGPASIDVEWMLYGLEHRRPLANGVLGYVPKSYRDLLRAMLRFPDPASLELLRDRDIRTLVVHMDRLGGTPWEGLPAKLVRRPDIREIGRAGTAVFYDLPYQ